MESTRSRSKTIRRERILLEARRMIAEQGFDALKLRDLAAVSELSVPTIYNLVGSKDDLVKALMLGVFADYELLMKEAPTVAPERVPVTMIDTLISMVAENEDFYRATFLAAERVEEQRAALGEVGFRRAPLQQIARRYHEDLRSQRLMGDDFTADTLVNQVYAGHHAAFRDWAYRLISLKAFRIRSLEGFYVALAADATPSFRDRLLREFRRL
jgi:AcrR family transcriptional regulator